MTESMIFIIIIIVLVAATLLLRPRRKGNPLETKSPGLSGKDAKLIRDADRALYWNNRRRSR